MLPAALLFDMDGTIVHSEPLWMRCETEFVHAHGGQWTQADAMRLVGNSLEVSGQILSEAVGGKFSGPEIISQLVAAMIRCYQSEATPWRPGFLDCIAEFHKAGVKLAVVSASYTRLVEAVVNAVPEHLIDTFVGGDMVTHDKPHPQPYLLAAEKLGVEINNCIVIEDSQTGISAGLASGAATVGIPCVKPIPLQPRLSRLKSLQELTLPVAQRIIAGEIIDTVRSDSWTSSQLH